MTDFLSQEQVDHFMAVGWVRISGAFSRAQAAEWTRDLWVRLGYDPHNKSTWVQEKINMPAHDTIDVREFAPQAWGAICDLVGGADRITPDSMHWGDSLIVNLGQRSVGKSPVAPHELDNWHVDGDNFIHFLDSPEQGLLVIPVLSDIEEDGGGTYICPDGIKVVAKHLYDHPEGLTPYMTREGEEAKEFEFSWFTQQVRSKCSHFQQMTGSVGDVILLHPLMVHSASINVRGVPRIITNPSVHLREPFKFDRKDPKDFSFVELKTLRELGVDRLPEWRIQGQRKALVPGRIQIHDRMREVEKRRLNGEDMGATGDTGVEVHRELVKSLYVPTSQLPSVSGAVTPI